MEAQPHIPIYTSTTQLLAVLGLISDHAYVIRCRQLSLFDSEIIARHGINRPTSSKRCFGRKLFHIVRASGRLYYEPWFSPELNFTPVKL